MKTLRDGMVNKGSRFADFVRFRPHTYNLHAHSTISAALIGGNSSLNALDAAFPLIMWLATFFPLYNWTSSSSKPEPSTHIPMLPMKLIKQWKLPNLTTIFSFLVCTISITLTHNGWSNVLLGVGIFILNAKSMIWNRVEWMQVRSLGFRSVRGSIVIVLFSGCAQAPEMFSIKPF